MESGKVWTWPSDPKVSSTRMCVNHPLLPRLRLQKHRVKARESTREKESARKKEREQETVPWQESIFSFTSDDVQANTCFTSRTYSQQVVFPEIQLLQTCTGLNMLKSIFLEADA